MLRRSAVTVYRPYRDARRSHRDFRNAEAVECLLIKSRSYAVAVIAISEMLRREIAAKAVAVGQSVAVIAISEMLRRV